MLYIIILELEAQLRNSSTGGVQLICPMGAHRAGLAGGGALEGWRLALPQSGCWGAIRGWAGGGRGRGGGSGKVGSTHWARVGWLAAPVLFVATGHSPVLVAGLLYTSIYTNTDHICAVLEDHF